jgi:hypothetical protein
VSFGCVYCTAQLKPGILWYICKLNYFDVLCNISFTEYLPEDGRNRRPKHVAGYADCNIINLYICI